MAIIKRRPRRRKAGIPWYRRPAEILAVFVGIVGVQVMFANKVDKDEYERIVGTSLVFVVRELMGRKEQ